MKPLSGKVAVVTGGSRGVGKGIALGLGEGGATVYVTGRTTQEGTDIEKLGGKVSAALANDPNLMNRTGKVWVGAALAQEYGIQDIDGKQPRPVTLEEA